LQAVGRRFESAQLHHPAPLAGELYRIPFEALAKKGRVAIDETDVARMRKLSERVRRAF
jgi:hypothetical protein